MEKKEAVEFFGGFFHLFSCPLRLKINSYIPQTQHLIELWESSCAEMRGFLEGGAIEATPCLGSMAGQQDVLSPSTSHLWTCFFSNFHANNFKVSSILVFANLKCATFLCLVQND